MGEDEIIEAHGGMISILGDENSIIFRITTEPMEISQWLSAEQAHEVGQLLINAADRLAKRMQARELAGMTLAPLRDAEAEGGCTPKCD